MELNHPCINDSCRLKNIARIQIGACLRADLTVRRVDEGSPADRADLRVDDLITHVEDMPISSTVDFFVRVAEFENARLLHMTVIRKSFERIDILFVQPEWSTLKNHARQLCCVEQAMNEHKNKWDWKPVLAGLAAVVMIAAFAITTPVHRMSWNEFLVSMKGQDLSREEVSEKYSFYKDSFG